MSTKQYKRRRGKRALRIQNFAESRLIDGFNVGDTPDQSMGAQTKKAAAYAAASLLFFDEIPDDLTADFVEQDHGQRQ